MKQFLFLLLLLGTVFFIIGPARGCPAFVVVDSYVSTPRLSNISPPHSPLRTPNSELRTPNSALRTPLSPQQLWDRLVAQPMSLAEGGWLHGFSFRCLRTTIASDGTRVTHPPLYVEADRRGVSLLAPGRALRATPDTLWLADSRYGTWLRCPRTAAASDGTNCYDKIMYECFRGIDRCCPALFTPFAYGQPATVSVRFDTAGRNRFTIFTQMLEVSAHPRHGASRRDTIRVCYSHAQGVVVWIERIPSSPRDPREHYDLADWQLSSLPCAPDPSDPRLGPPPADGWRRYDLPAQCPRWLSSRQRGGRVLTADIAHFPLVGASADTVRLADDRQWRLVVLWDYDQPGWPELQQQLCAPARPGALLTRLEEAGINLYCVNPYGGCTEAFRRVAVQSGLPQRFFAARDLEGLDCRRLPAACLYRPDGRLACALSGPRISIDHIINIKQNIQ